MTKRTSSILLWVLAFVLTVVIAVYQRMTGPTHPVRGTEIVEGKEISYRLLRSYTAFEKLPVKITVPDEAVTAFLNFKRYKTSDESSC